MKSPRTSLTSTRPLLHCCETWQVLASKDEFLTNRPEQPETWEAMAGLDRHLLQLIEKEGGRLIPRVTRKER